MERPTVLYRVVNYGPTLKIITYNIFKYTPRGYWIKASSDTPYDLIILDNNGTEWIKWTSNKAKNRFAYPTKKEAYHNFIKRIERHIKIVNNSLRNSYDLLDKAKKLYDETK